MCVRVGDVYAVTAGGGLSFARDSTGGARIVRKLSSTVRAPPHTVLHGTLSLSPQNQPPPRPFNLFLLLLFQVSLHFNNFVASSVLPNKSDVTFT